MILPKTFFPSFINTDTKTHPVFLSISELKEYPQLTQKRKERFSVLCSVQYTKSPRNKLNSSRQLKDSRNIPEKTAVWWPGQTKVKLNMVSCLVVV